MHYLTLVVCLVAAGCSGGTPSATTSSNISGGAGIPEAGNESDLRFRGTLEATESVNGAVHLLVGSVAMRHISGASR